MNLYNKNQLIASNLARENIELFRNLRDNNYKLERPWNMTSINNEDFDDLNNRFLTWSYYKLENDFSSNDNIKVDKINNFWEGISEVKDTWKMQNYRLCLNSTNYYTYDCSLNNTKTNFYRYLKIEDVNYNSGWINKTINDAYKITSKVYWYDKWLHDIEIKTIVSDFIRL